MYNFKEVDFSNKLLYGNSPALPPTSSSCLRRPVSPARCSFPAGSSSCAPRQARMRYAEDPAHFVLPQWRSAVLACAVEAVMISSWVGAAQPQWDGKQQQYGVVQSEHEKLAATRVEGRLAAHAYLHAECQPWARSSRWCWQSQVLARLAAASRDNPQVTSRLQHM